MFWHPYLPAADTASSDGAEFLSFRSWLLIKVFCCVATRSVWHKNGKIQTANPRRIHHEAVEDTTSTLQGGKGVWDTNKRHNWEKNRDILICCLPINFLHSLKCINSLTRWPYEQTFPLTCKTNKWLLGPPATTRVCLYTRVPGTWSNTFQWNVCIYEVQLKSSSRHIFHSIPLVTCGYFTTVNPFMEVFWELVLPIFSLCKCVWAVWQNALPNSPGRYRSVCECWVAFFFFVCQKSSVLYWMNESGTFNVLICCKADLGLLFL